MKQIKVQMLEAAAYLPFGRYADIIHPTGSKIGAEPVLFYRDMLTVFFNCPEASFSVVQCRQRPLIIDEAEQHDYTAEALLPLDGDVIIFAAPATSGNVPHDEIQAFYVPRGTIVTFAPGVWHKAPYAVNTEVVNCLVLLPQRTYANDCRVVSFKESEKIEIVPESPF